MPTMNSLIEFDSRHKQLIVYIITKQEIYVLYAIWSIYIKMKPYCPLILTGYVRIGPRWVEGGYIMQTNT